MRLLLNWLRRSSSRLPIQRSSRTKHNLLLELLEARDLLSAPVDPWPSTATGVIPLNVSQVTASATGFDNSHIWIAVFGQLIVTPLPGQTPPPGPTYYLDAANLRTVGGQQEPDPQSTGLLSSGPTTPDSVTLPSSTLSDWGNLLSLPIPPAGNQYTGRIVISAGAPVQAQVAANGSVSAPSAANPTDPSTGTFYDFLEFTITNNNGVPQADIDTSQVDSFGMPLQLQFFQDAAGTTPYPSGNVTNATNATPIVITSPNHGLTTGNVVTVSGVAGNTAANGAFNVTVIDANTFSLDGSAGNGAYTSGGFWTTGGGPVGISTARDTILTGTTSAGYLDFVRSQILSLNTNASPFLESYATTPNTQSMPITDATNATPIVITSANHGLTTGAVVSISGVGGNAAANGIFTVTVVDANTFSLDGSTGSGAYTSGGAWSAYSVPLRLVSPKDVVEALPNTSTDPLNTYFDSTLDSFFLKYLPSDQTVSGHAGGGQTFSIASQASGTNLTYTGTTQLVGGNYVLRLTTTGDATNYDIYYPFFTTNLPSNYTPLFTPGPAPSWITSPNNQESPTQMVFACDGVFADNTKRGLSNTQSSVLGDLENSVSAGLNRGIALNAPSTWGDMTTWFPTNGIYNYWVQYWHQDGLAINNQAYAFPYDDKFGTSTNLQQNNVGVVKVTLGSWGSSGTSTTSFANFPSSGTQGGQVTLTANVAGATTPTGTVTFYIDGVAINSTNAGPSPLLQPVTISSGTATLTANLPALPDGGHTHTYTVTAVYSGDANHLPSIAEQSLKLTGSLGDFAVNPAPSTGPLGTSVTVTTLLPGNPTTGSVAFSIVDSNGNTVRTIGTVPVISGTVTETAVIPTNLLAFTGNTVFGTTTITSVSSVANLIVGQVVTGPGIPAGTTISSFAASPTPGTNSITLSQKATATASNVTFTSDANKDVYRIKAVFGTLTGYGNFTVAVTTGSSVASEVFSGTAANTFDRARVTFNKAIDPASFTASDVLNLTDPTGNAISVTGITPVGTDGMTFDVTFAPQAALGEYSITTGPDILDLAGYQIDQNHDGINGENPSDQFTENATLSVAQPPTFAVGGSDGSVQILNAVTGATIVKATGLLDAPGSRYTGLVEVALGDFNGDGVDDLLVAAANPAGVNGLAASKAGHVFVFDGATLLQGTVPTTFIREFTPFAHTDGPGGSAGAYTNGLNIAVADVNGDQHVDLIAGTRSGTATSGRTEYGRFVVVDGTSPAGSNNTIGAAVKPFGNTYSKGVVVAGGDLSGDGKAEVAVTRGGPVAASNPNKTLKIKAFQLSAAGSALNELNLSGTGSPLAPFAGLGSGSNVIDRDARLAFVDQNGDGIAELAFTALDRVTDPANVQVRIATFEVSPTTGLATPLGTGTGPSNSFLDGTHIIDHAITHVDANSDGIDGMALLTQSATSQIQFVNPITGGIKPGGFLLNVLNGGVSLDGI